MPYHNILLIDDDPDDHEIFLSALEMVSANVGFTGLKSAGEALQKLAAKNIIPDVIFLDLNMPLMNGQQFLQEIKKNEDLRAIPVIIYSTSSHSKIIQQTKELGADDFITKPDKLDDLRLILKSVIG